MKILQVCSARTIGGGERHLVDLANALVDRGHEVFAALAPDSPLIKELSSIPSKNLAQIRMRNSVDIFSAAAIARLVRDESIDLIHAHVARDYPLVALASLRSGNTPYVITRHVLFRLKRSHKILLRRVAKVIAVSHAVKRSLQDQGIFPLESIVTIHNGIDSSRFAAHQRQRRDNEPARKRAQVGIVGHISWIKGQDDFVRAAAIVVSKCQDVDFVIIGTDKSRAGQNQSMLYDLIVKLGIEDRVRFAGWRDDVGAALAELDVFVSCARSEPFGLAIAEAMAGGLPIISTMSEGAQELIENGISGRLVPIGAADDLANAIMDLLGNDYERCRLGRNAARTVRQRFSLERMVAAIEAVYYQANQRD